MADTSSKTSINLSKITKLKNSSGWKKWRAALDEWVVDQDLDLDPPAEPEVPPARASQARQDEYNEVYKEYDEAIILWKRKQLKAVNSIKSVCEDRGKNFLQGLVLIQDALDKLEEEFKPKGDASFQEVYTKWVGLNLTGCKDVDDYVEDFEDLYSRLLALDPTYSLPRVDLVMKFVNGLGAVYGSWLQSFNLTHSLTGTSGTTLSEVEGLARTEEQRLAREGAVAMVSSAYPPADRSRKRKACNGCDSTFHMDAKCWVLHPELEAEWRRENPEKAAARDARLRGRKQATTAYKGKKTRAASPSSSSDDTSEPPAIRAAGLAIRSHRV
jgi:hypothetical protein